MKYELIKEFPGSPKKGTMFETDPKAWIDADDCRLKQQSEMDMWPEYYQPVNLEDCPQAGLWIEIAYAFRSGIKENTDPKIVADYFMKTYNISRK